MPTPQLSSRRTPRPADPIPKRLNDGSRPSPERQSYLEPDERLNTVRPGKMADSPSSSSIRISWLYLARRSEGDSEPVLICPQLVATARSAIVASSVSPERWDITAV